MKKLIASASVAVVGLLALSNLAFADEKPLSKPEIEAIVKKVISDNPELIVQSLQNYKLQKDAEALVKANDSLKVIKPELSKETMPSAGNPKGDVTIMEFFDYHCGYCKRFYGEVSKLIQDDKNVRVVFVEFPILSPDSREASKAALAVNNIDKSKYFAFHTALMQAQGGFNQEVLNAKAKELGIDTAKMEKEMANPEIEKQLNRNKDIAIQLNISGTPAIIIGNEVVGGAISYEELKKKVDEARLNKKG